MNQEIMPITPWGPALTTEEVTAGVTIVETEGHGGMRLTLGRQTEMRLAGVPEEWIKEWYEEDCEVAVVMLAFCDEFDPPSVARALKMVVGIADDLDLLAARWKALLAWTGSSGTKINERIALNYCHSGTCPLCNDQFQVYVRESEYLGWKSGVLIQEAMPDLSLDDRERFQTGICHGCWETMERQLDDE